jgi:hypothetical protein
MDDLVQGVQPDHVWYGWVGTATRLLPGLKLRVFAM